MPTTPEEFQRLVSSPEGARIEFKTAANSYEFDKLLRYCVALANEGQIDVQGTRRWARWFLRAALPPLAHMRKDSEPKPNTL